MLFPFRGPGMGTQTSSVGCWDQVTSWMLCLSGHPGPLVGPLPLPAPRPELKPQPCPPALVPRTPTAPVLLSFQDPLWGETVLVGPRDGLLRQHLRPTDPAVPAHLRDRPWWVPGPRRGSGCLPRGTCTCSSPLRVSVPAGRGVLAWPGSRLVAHQQHVPLALGRGLLSRCCGVGPCRAPGDAGRACSGWRQGRARTEQTLTLGADVAVQHKPLPVLGPCSALQPQTWAAAPWGRGLPSSRAALSVLCLWLSTGAGEGLQAFPAR